MSGGSPGTTQVHSTPGTQDPGAGAAGDFFRSLFSGNLPPFPFQYPGSLDPGLSPTLQNAIRMAQGFSQAGPPEVLQGVRGALGRFMSPSFQNPMVRGGMGYPDYFGGLANRVFGGQPANQLGLSGPVDASGSRGGYGRRGYPGGGGYGYPVTQPLPWDQPLEGMDVQQPGGAGAPGTTGTAMTPSVSAVNPVNSAATTDKGLLDWMSTQGIAPTYDAGGMPVFSQRVPGAHTAWSAGAGANKGETRRNPQTGQIEIYRATGQGGESFGWTPYDPNNSGHVLDATMFQRYGNNWTSGAGAGGAGGHSTDVTAELRAQLGREPTMFEVQDAMYGVKPGGFQYSSQPPPAAAPASPAQPPVTPPGTGTMTPVPKPTGAAGGTGTVGGGGGTATGAPPSYGGYTTAQLQNQSRLLRLLGPHALQRWMQAHPGAGGVAGTGTGAAGPRPRGGARGVGAMGGVGMGAGGGVGAGAIKPIMPPPPPTQIKAFG